MNPQSKNRNRAAVPVVGWIHHELVVERHMGIVGKGPLVKTFHDPFRTRMGKLAVADRKSKPTMVKI